MDQDAVFGIIKKFKKALESLNIQVEQLILFGSHAVGTAREDSDIDLVVISPSFSGKTYWERIDILTEAIYTVFAPIEATAFTPDEWKSGKSLISDYAKDGVLVS
ncbi:MAG: nucleotidyltransferase domain-containing protein [Deltaproteobacteria bacterium]|nr:nucleotidyltransferase domain-containing protein [Deltaproteobacteria bacterium]